MISVVIPVLEYSEKLRVCLSMLMKNQYGNFEVIIVYQGQDDLIADKINRSGKKLRIINIGKSNLSRAYTIGAAHSEGEIIAFLSGDCYPKKTWLREIDKSLKKRSHWCVTGNTYPYLKSLPNNNYVCFCTYTDPMNRLIDKPCYHTNHIGFSNNFAIKKKYLMTLGSFREIFSPGNFGIHAADADLFLRILIDNKTIIHNPDMAVSHDHWLNKTDALRTNLKYIGGEVACYGLYALKGYAVGRKVLYNNFIGTPRRDIKEIFSYFMKGDRKKGFERACILYLESIIRISALFRSLLIFLAGY